MTPPPSHQNALLLSPLSEGSAALLRHFADHQCLGNHDSGLPSTLARALKQNEDDLWAAWQTLERQGLITREQRWTGSWRRIVPTRAGHAMLRQI